MLIFGVEFPEGTVRIVIRPILGAGNAQPLYDGRVGDEGLAESEVVAAAAKNTAFWEYIDSRVSLKKITPPEDGDWSWRLRLEPYNGAGAKGEVKATEEKIAFYRAGTKNQGLASEMEAALLTLRTVGAEIAKGLSEMAKAGAEYAKAGAAPASEAIKALTEMRRDDMAFRDEAMKTIGGLNAELRDKKPAADSSDGSGPFEMLRFLRDAKSFLKKPN